MSEDASLNKLRYETSPYLLQHANNPVHWHPWGEEALSRAIVEDKPILVSIGYAACHWCHVMEKQSFEDVRVANVMNDNFVCIKVDREERPDIDQVYMNAVQLITGGGGWPLNCFALPDGSPFYGGTYFPKEDWLNVLDALTNYWKNDKSKLIEHALQVKKGMLGSDIVFEKVNDSSIESSLPKDVVSSWKNYFDMDFGGENRAPKFPMPNNYDFLLAHSYYSNDADVQEFVKLTLNRMSEGGIYDHVGGGFARYSVDKFWKVPHFEKMLYDNAQLISLYSKAYKKYKTSNYSNVVKNSVVFINREMTSTEGGFYSSYDADSEGEEGKFYVWSLKELKDILGEKAGVFIDFYSVTPNGNWEQDKNVLHITKQSEFVARDHGISLDELFETIENANNLLYEERKKRVPPSLDDKILTSWNALTIIGFLDAYQAFSVSDYLSLAKRTATFISTQLMEDDGRLSRNYKAGKKSINAFLDDYSFAASAFIKLFENTGELNWLQKAEKLVNYSLAHFFDNKSGMFYYTSDLDASLVVRKMEISDNVIPSSNSAMAKNLFLLSRLLGNDEYRSIAIQMLANVKEEVLRYNRYYSNWADLANWLVHPFYEIIVVGDNAEKVVQEINSIYIPNCVVAYSLIESDFLLFKDRFKEEKTLIYICKDNACQMPVETVEEALELVNH